MSDTLAESPIIGRGAGPLRVSRNIGDYELMSQLGRGGMGVVYLARRLTDGQLVALKTVHTEGEVALRSIRREIHALATLRHPSVVRILGQGVSDGLPWYVMEYVVGPTLRARIGRTDTTASLDASPSAANDHEEKTPEPLPLDEVLRIGLAISRALSYLHGEGVVHRDLKPSNIILRPDGAVVLVDFGLTTAVTDEAGREVLDGGALPIGTPAYASPEQIAGELVDARADLYSLGCVLYEMAVGRPPFVGHAAQLLEAHAREAPVPPSQRRAGLPVEFDALVMALLRKDVAERPGHAGDVAHALVAMGAAVDGTATDTAQSYLYRPRFVGRREIANQVAEQFIRGGNATRCAFLEGESGSGKTRLAHEIARRLRGSAVRVVTAHCVPIDEGDHATAAVMHPFGELLTTVADQCRAGGSAATARLLGGHCRILAAYEPRLAWVPGYESYPTPEALPPDAERERLLFALDQTLLRLADGGRLLLVFEDLHWADQLTHLYLRGVNRGQFGGPWLSVLGTYRLDEAGEELLALVAPHEASRTTLRPMASHEVAEMVAGMLAVERCPDALRFVTEDSGGNPFFAAEMLRSLLADERIAREVGGGWRVLPSVAGGQTIPSALHQVVAQRLTRLSPAARQLADLAAIAGRDFDFAILEGASELPDATRLDALNELLSRQVLEEHGAAQLRFIHDRVRAVIIRLLEEPVRRRLHHACADALERNPVRTPRVHQLLAHHCSEAKLIERAEVHLAAVAEHALATGAYREAASAVDVASRLQQPADRERTAAWERRGAQARLGLGELDVCETHARRALTAAVARPPQSRLAWVALLSREVARQALHLLAPQAWIGRTRDAALVDAAQVAGVLGRLSLFANDPLRMVACSFWSINLAERAGANVERPRNYAGLGFTVGLAGAKRLSAHYFRRARQTGEASHDLPGLTFALTTQILSYVGDGAWDAANEAALAAKNVTEQTGDPQEQELVAVLSSYPAHYRGAFSDSMQLLDQADVSARRRGNAQTQAWVEFLRGRVALVHGRLDEAETQIEAALRTIATQPDAMSELVSWGLLAETCALRDDLAGASRAAREIERLLKQGGPTVFLIAHGHIGLAEYELLRARQARRDGDRASARTFARNARAAGRTLARLAWMFPVVLADARRLIGQAALALDDRRGAERAFRLAIASAEGLAMPYHAAQAAIGLAAALPAVNAQRETLLRDAERALVAMGCSQRFHIESQRHATT